MSFCLMTPLPIAVSCMRGYPFLRLLFPPNPADMHLRTTYVVLANTVLLFITFFFSFLILTIFAIKLDKCLNRRRGGGKKDQVIREEMRWAEGREILERKIIWQGKMGGEGK